MRMTEDVETPDAPPEIVMVTGDADGLGEAETDVGPGWCEGKREFAPTRVAAPQPLNTKERPSAAHSRDPTSSHPFSLNFVTVRETP